MKARSLVPLLFFFLFSFYGKGQTPDSVINNRDQAAFRFWISDIDKAGDSRITYIVSQDSVIVKKGPYDFIYFAKNHKDDKVVFRSGPDNGHEDAFIRLARDMRSDDIHGLYDNTCIIDGLILYFHFEWKGKTKNVSVSNYYLESIAPLIRYVNKRVPKELLINYSKSDLRKSQKGCETILIGD